ncbi:MAG: ribonuclease H-like domain-containing protein, partial [Acidobacteriota bacterium]|nr:ribonuclease H-like domain-containing protein [Acidobacteriota bacterium]
LDTETTGLAGGSGTYAFLIGIGSIDPEGFRVRQFFMRDYHEEPSVLASLAAYLARFDVLITYNGRSYDQPLLETRYTMCRARHPFARMEHLDLLFGSRRLFKLRLQNCRLVNLENQILGVERQGDIPGEMIPWCYFEYLRTKRASRLASIFQHNVLDIVSLACLTGLIPEAFRDPENMRARHGTDLLGMARWLQMAGRFEEALRMMRRAVDKGLPDQHLFRTLFEAGAIEKKLGLEHAALATFTDLTISPNPFRVRAYEELAKHYEHRDRNFAMAMECVRAARCIEDSETLALRQQRLHKKCAALSKQPKLRLAARIAR